MSALRSVVKLLSLAQPVADIVSKLIDKIAGASDPKLAAERALNAVEFEQAAKKIPVKKN